jgi:hypothetical protein
MGLLNMEVALEIKVLWREIMEGAATEKLKSTEAGFAMSGCGVCLFYIMSYSFPSQQRLLQGTLRYYEDKYPLLDQDSLLQRMMLPHTLPARPLNKIWLNYVYTQQKIITLLRSTQRPHLATCIISAPVQRETLL